MHISARFVDGSVVEGDTRTFMCFADRVKFEHHFGISTAVMQEWGKLFDDDGKPLEEADFSVVKEEYLGFFVWRVLRRLEPDTVPEYDEFIDTLADFKTGGGEPEADDISGPEGELTEVMETEGNPTAVLSAPGAQPISSP